jgi:hypothetical protein
LAVPSYRSWTSWPLFAFTVEGAMLEINPVPTIATV